MVDLRYIFNITSTFCAVVAFFATTALADSPCDRIVSLAPSITEIIYKLDKGDNLIGVTDYCIYPRKAQKKKKLGGYLNFSIEQLVSLSPSIVFALTEQKTLIQRLQDLNIKVVTVNHDNVAEIINSITIIGSSCKKEVRATEVIDKINNRIKKISLSEKPSHSKVIIVVGRDSGRIYIAGTQNLYSELLTIAGGVNSFKSTLLSVPTLSKESLISLNPDAIIEILPPGDSGVLDKNEIISEWSKEGAVNAVKNNKILVLDKHVDSIPGPRFPIVINKIKRFLNS